MKMIRSSFENVACKLILKKWWRYVYHFDVNGMNYMKSSMIDLYKIATEERF